MTYDVFISFKNSSKDGLATPDAIAARKVYQALKSQNIKAFFSEESLAEEGRGHFSKAIEQALETSRVLVLVASCREHIESQWVEAEWDSFSQDIRSGNKTGELFIYNCGSLRPNDLPLFLRRQQMFAEVGLEKLIKFVSSAIPSTPTLDSFIQLSLHCFHPEKNEDKIYLVTVQKGTSANAHNVTAHWGARTAKRLSSQIKAINVTGEAVKAEIEKAKQEKLRGGYKPAAHKKLLTDEARAFLSASLGLNEVQKTPSPTAARESSTKKKTTTAAARAKESTPVKPKTVTPVKTVSKATATAAVKVVAKRKTAIPVQEAGKPTAPAKAKVAAKPKAATPVKGAAKPKSKAASKTVCISGKLPSGKKKADYEAPLRAAGYELVDDVVKGLSYLVLADPDSTTGKSEKARKLGVKVISEKQLSKIVR